MSTHGETWQQLPESARKAILEIADRCREGFSGEIRLNVHQGGVRWVEESRRWALKNGEDV